MSDKSFVFELKDKLFKGFAVYLGSSIVNKAIPFLLLPILTKYLSAEEYGILAIYQVMISFGMPVLGMNMQNNITRNFFSKSKNYVAKLVFNLIVVLTISTILFSLFIFIYLAFGGSSFSIPQKWLYAIPLITYMNMLNMFNLTILRNLKHAKEYGIFEISKTFLDLTVSIILIICFVFGWEGRAVGIITAAIIMGVISLYKTWKSGYVIIDADLEKINEILRISLPLIPYALGGTIITLSDRLFIDQMISTSEVGIYTVGYQFGMIITLVVAAFNKTWSPWMYEKLETNSNENKRTIVKATYLVSCIYILLAFLIYIISNTLLPLMTTATYHVGIKYVLWIALGYSFNGIFAALFPFSVYVGRTRMLGLIGAMGAVINLSLNYVLIFNFGAVGAAYATLLTYILMAIGLLLYSNKIFPMPWLLRQKKG